MRNPVAEDCRQSARDLIPYLSHEMATHSADEALDVVTRRQLANAWRAIRQGRRRPGLPRGGVPVAFEARQVTVRH